MHTAVASPSSSPMGFAMVDFATITQEPQGRVDMGSLDDLPPSLCCCSLLEETLGPNQHLADCELQYYSLEFSLPSSDDTSETSSSVGSRVKGRETGAKRKHRESMARLRQKLRQSIGTLQLQERQLSRTLQRTMAQFQRALVKPIDARVKLQQAYFDLVNEQLALEEERRMLEETSIQQDKYERLVQREILRMEEAKSHFADFQVVDETPELA